MMRRISGRWYLCLALVLAACGPDGLPLGEPQDKTVPTVMFLTFESGSSEIEESGKTLLRNAARYAKRFDNVALSVAGHSTDMEFAMDPDLDLKRINEAVEILKGYGVTDDKITRIPRDNAEKVDPSDPDSEANRRVDVLFVVFSEQGQATAAAPAPSNAMR